MTALGQNRHLSGVSVTDGLPSAPDAPLQRGKLAKSAISGHSTEVNRDYTPKRGQHVGISARPVRLREAATYALKLVHLNEDDAFLYNRRPTKT